MSERKKRKRLEISDCTLGSLREKLRICEIVNVSSQRA